MSNLGIAWGERSFSAQAVPADTMDVPRAVTAIARTIAALLTRFARMWPLQVVGWTTRFGTTHFDALESPMIPPGTDAISDQRVCDSEELHQCT